MKKQLLLFASCLSIILTGCSGRTVPATNTDPSTSAISIDETSSEAISTDGETHPVSNNAAASLITTARVNLRTAPSDQSEILLTLDTGTEVSQLSSEDGWIQVSYDGTTGYISAEYLTVSPAVQSETAAPVEIVPPSQELLDSIASLPTAGQGFGAGDQFDENNIPILLTQTYEAKYGKYATFRGAPDSKTVYLTFDLGWENTTPEGVAYTSLILDIMKEKNVKGSFYITYGYAQSRPEIIRRLIAEGHIIGSHGYAHPEDGLPSMTLEQQIEDTLKMQNYVQETFGYHMTEYRFGSGIFSPQTLALISGMGYHIYFWSVNYTDWIVESQPDPASSLEYLTARLHPGAIYMLHTVSSTNVQILEQFIDNTRNAGYEFGYQ